MPDSTVAPSAVSEFAQALPLYVALGCYAAALLATFAWSKIAVWLLRVGAVIHFTAMLYRGLAIGFFPLTNKVESFSTAALAIALVTAATWRDVRCYAGSLLALCVITLLVALQFPLGLSFPPPLMRTIWYPLHVPLSFTAYALWAAAAAAALVWLRERDPAWLLRVDRLALQGFGVWSVSMVCGGIWGVVAWGAYFMWDVKIIWSVILWFHYASFIHLRLTPSLSDKPWVRPLLALVGFVWVLVAYVGTSFFFGRSSHAF